MTIKLNNALPPANRNATYYLQGNYHKSMVVTQVSPIDNISVIRTLKNKKSNVDEISVHIIKRSSEWIAYPIALLFNQPISTGNFFFFFSI